MICVDPGPSKPSAIQHNDRTSCLTSGAKLTHRRISAVPSGERRHISCLEKMNVLGIEPPDLLLEHFFDLSDLLLNFAGVFFDVAFGL
jgi:hypothetical protein